MPKCPGHEFEWGFPKLHLVGENGVYLAVVESKVVAVKSEDISINKGIVTEDLRSKIDKIVEPLLRESGIKPQLSSLSLLPLARKSASDHEVTVCKHKKVVQKIG